MKAKRVLAAILCAAMIFSSESFSMGVLATETSEPAATPAVVEDQEKGSTPEASQTPDATEEAEDTQSPSVTQQPEDAQSPSVTQEPEGSQSPDNSEEPEETPTPERGDTDASQSPAVTPTPGETPGQNGDEGGNPDAVQTPSALPGATAEPEEINPEESPALSDMLGEGISPTPDMIPEPDDLLAEDELELVEASDAYITVVDGVLGIKDGVTSFPSTLIIPDEATEIPDRLFKNTNIQIIKFNDTSSLTSIGIGAFEGSTLTSINIPAGVTEIKEDTFKNSALASITFDGSAVESVGKEAFMNTNLANFRAPSALKTIGESAFSSCLLLSNLTLGNVEEISSRAFQNCKKLRDGGIGWSSSLKIIGSYAFQGCGFSNLSMTTVNADGANEVIIGDGAFAYCTEMTAIRLPKNLKTISNRVFLGCTNLTGVTLPEETETIESNAFEGCTALARIEIPANVTTIKSKAFSSCSALKEIIINQKDTTSDAFVIAEDAFPTKTGVTMWGYDGKVQDYAEKMGYTFETLSEKYTIYMSSDFAAHASLVVSKNPAIAGEEITITVTPKSGYCLREGTLTVKGKSEAEASLVSCTSTKQVFSFIMPEGMPTSSGEKQVVIDAEFLSTSDAGSGELAYRLDKVNNQPIDSEDYVNNKFTMKKTGSQAQLIVYGTQTIGSWLLTYKSSNTSVATISSTGIICAKGKGDATITATLRSNTSKKISFVVHVEEDAVIDQLELKLGSPNRATLKTVEVEEIENGHNVTKVYQVIEFNKATLAAASQSFKVSFNAKESGSTATNLIVDSTWASVDSSIASVSSSKSSDNSNTITVKKGVEGETTITVTVTNKDKTVCKESFIIRVIDATPRLADTKIAVNSLSTVGAAIDIVPVYGYDINSEVELQLCKKKTSGSMISYEDYNDLRIEYDSSEDTYRMIASEDLKLASGKSLSFKGSSQLYIRGEFEQGGTFIIPVPEITVTNKALNPTVKLTGKINLFYNSTASDAEQGSIQVTQSLTTETVEKYELVSAANYKKAGSEEEDTFAANFTIDENGVIRRSDRETLAQVSGKNVVSGYLYIYYEGYSEPVKKSIKLSTCNTSPSYVLSTTSATASVYKSGQEYQLYLLDKKTKAKIDLSNIDTVSFDYSNTGTTRELFTDLSTSDVETDSDGNDYINLQVDGTPFKGKAVINVKMSTWSKSLKYTFTLKTTSTLATFKFSSSTATLNSLCKSQGATLTGTLNQADAEMQGFDEDTLTYTGSKKTAEEAKKLNITFEGASIKISLPDSETVKAGTYSFKVRPVVQYGSRSVTLNYVTFKVTVKSSIPTVKLKSSTLTLNAKCPGDEVVSTTYTINNLPAGSTYTVDTDDVRLSAVSKNSIAAADMINNIELTCEDGSISAKLSADGIYAKSFSYDYYVNGLKIKIGGEAEEIELSPFKLKIKGTLTNPSIKVTAKGTLNPVDATSSIVYTAKVSNIVSDISDISIRELNLTDNKNDYYRDDNNNPISEHFELEWVGNTAVVKAKDGAGLTSGASYKIQLVFRLSAVAGKQYVTSDITIKPKQTLPKIKADKTTAYLYAGQNRAKTVDVAITKTTLTGAEIENVVFAKGTAEAIQRAYRISYDEDTGVMTLRLVNPSLLVMNKKYTITFETKCKNQLENSTGTTFKMTVTVRK